MTPLLAFKVFNLRAPLTVKIYAPSTINVHLIIVCSCKYGRCLIVYLSLFAVSVITNGLVCGPCLLSKSQKISFNSNSRNYFWKITTRVVTHERQQFFWIIQKSVKLLWIEGGKVGNRFVSWCK